MDHLDCAAGEVIPKNKRLFHKLFEPAILDGIKYQPRIKLSQESQRADELLSITAHFSFNSSVGEHLANLKIFAKSMLRGRFSASPAQLLANIRTFATVGLPMIYRYVANQRIYSPADLGVKLHMSSEQTMRIESAIKLKEERDSLGMQKVAMNWHVDGMEIKTLSVFAKRIKSYLEREGIAQVNLSKPLVDEDRSLIAELNDMYHHMGMTRMSVTSETGVVDQNLKLHGSQNIYVCGASVYPSTGFANPTFTALALSSRLADFLAAKTQTE